MNYFAPIYMDTKMEDRFICKNTRLMTTETIKATIEARYKSKRAFIIAFNQKAGFEALDETALSRQLSERVALSNGWKAAYKLFFDSLNVGACV